MDCEVLNPLTKYEGFSYPTHFSKSSGSVNRINFIEYRTKQATLLAQRNNFYALLATNKAKHILDRLVSSSSSGLIYSKRIQENRKSPIFESFPYLY